jgi:hypothetical protein
MKTYVHWAELCLFASRMLVEDALHSLGLVRLLAV